MLELDRIDRRILQLLQKCNRLTNLQLAQKARISPPTCLRRVRRLRAEQVIVADISLVDPLRVGKSFFVFIEVALERQSEQLQQAFERKMERAEEVAQCYMVSGPTDFAVVVQVADMEAYHEFVRRTFTHDVNIRKFRSLFVMKRTKFRTEISLAGG